MRSVLNISFRSWFTYTTYFMLNSSSIVYFSYIWVHACMWTETLWCTNLNTTTCLPTSCTANYNTVKPQCVVVCLVHDMWMWCKHKFLDFLITNGHLAQTVSLCSSVVRKRKNTQKTIEEICSCHILSIPAAPKGLVLGVVSVLPCLWAVSGVCTSSSLLMFYTGCAAEPQISCLVPSRRSSGQWLPLKKKSLKYKNIWSAKYILS